MTDLSNIGPLIRDALQRTIDAQMPDVLLATDEILEPSSTGTSIEPTITSIVDTLVDGITIERTLDEEQRMSTLGMSPMSIRPRDSRRFNVLSTKAAPSPLPR